MLDEGAADFSHAPRHGLESATWLIFLGGTK